MAAVFSSVIGITTLTTVGDAEHQLSGVAHSSLTAEQKEKKKLAKRIIKAIQPQFEDALRSESDLAGRPYERELPNLEALLDQSLRQRQSAHVRNENAIKQALETSQAHEAGQDDGFGNGSAEEGKAKEEDSMHLAPTPDDDSADHHLHVQDDAADEAAIAAQFGQDAMHLSTNGVHGDAMDIDRQDNEEGHSGAPPLTPPRSERDLLAFAAQGGIPWYMEPFSPVGTTIHDEKWSGRDLLRDMSEELSDMDDDELDGLAEPEEQQPADGTAPETTVSESQQKAARKKKRPRYR
jgi:NuA3 HAT complex component NTO1